MDTPGSSTPPESSDSSSQAKRRRQVAFYPHMNSSNKPEKPFSRSAAKRESVMALGSIEYLQHYFTKTGIAAESEYVFYPFLLSERMLRCVLQSVQEANQGEGSRDRWARHPHEARTKPVVRAAPVPGDPGEHAPNLSAVRQDVRN